jgi:uncharacterized protein (DUF305 family)
MQSVYTEKHSPQRRRGHGEKQKQDLTAKAQRTQSKLFVKQMLPHRSGGVCCKQQLDTKQVVALAI